MNFLYKIRGKTFIIFFLIFCFGWNPKTVITGDVASFPGYRVPYKVFKILANWQKKIYHLKFAWFVKSHLIGEKNGDSIGKELNFAQRDVLVKNMKIKSFKNLKKIIILFVLMIPSNLNASFFEDLTSQIVDNPKRLSYGVSVTDVNQDGNFDFIVTGFGYLNLALSYDEGKLINIVNQKKFSDEFRRTIGVAACDIDKDGYEEIYFLNTDTYSGTKKYSDRLMDLEKDKFIDLFEIEKNQKDLNLTAGRSVVCVDRKGDGNYGVYVANYGGPTRYYEYNNEVIVDKSVQLNLAKVTGGRAVVAGHIISDKIDVFAANERGANFLYKNDKGKFLDVAYEYRVEDVLQNGRGTALSDIYYRGRLDILNGNWGGFHRAYVLKNDIFEDIAKPPFDEPSRIRTVISADLDNDGYDEIFLNNIGEPNKLF